MSIHAKCPACAHEFVIDMPTRHSSTLRSLEPVHEPIREGVPVCAVCGLIERFHGGTDDLAAARGCRVFVEE